MMKTKYTAISSASVTTFAFAFAHKKVLKHISAATVARKTVHVYS